MRNFIVPLLSTLILISSPAVYAQDPWDAVKTYEYGDDFKPLLAVEKDVEASTASPGEKAKTATRLAALLTEETTLAGRQFVFMQLRLAGGASEVPKIAEYLYKKDDRENARMALADIPCEEALVQLRKALDTFEGESLVGVVGSLAKRGDKVSIPAFVKLLDSKDKTVVAAVVAALGRFGTEGVEPLKTKFETLPDRETAYALVEAANDLAALDRKEEAGAIFALLAKPGLGKGIRRATLEGTLRLLDNSARKSTISQWFFEDDADKNVVAAARLNELSAEEFDGLLKKIDAVGPQGRVVLLEIASQHKSKELLDALLKSARSSDKTERITALRALGKSGDASTIPVLLQFLGDDADTSGAVREALTRFDANLVGPRLVEALNNPAQRKSAVDMIVTIKYYDAISPMIKLAKQDDEAVYEPIIDGLGRLCDPDEHDIPRLLDLYSSSRPGKHRDRAERAVVVVCEKQADAGIRANILLDILGKRDGGLSDDVLTQMLPLLGKVGNKRVAELLIPLLENEKPELKRAAVRGLCNWPNADYLDELWNIATKNTSEQYRQWALRAYIRVATLKSERPESETLALLKKAMDVAVADADKQFCLGRTSAIRTMESAEWAASFLDDPALAETACRAIVELAHHRFLREPNKAKFEPILLKVEKTAKDKDVAARAQKSRLGM